MEAANTKWVDEADVESVIQQQFEYVQSNKEDIIILADLLERMDIVFMEKGMDVYKKPIGEAVYAHLKHVFDLVLAFESSVILKINILNICGWFLVRMNKKEDALACYNQALELDKNWDWLYRQKGLVYDWTGDRENAIAEFQKAIDINPIEPEYHWLLANVYRCCMQYKNALDEYENVVRYADCADEKQATRRKKAGIWVCYLEKKMDLFGEEDNGEL